MAMAIDMLELGFSVGQGVVVITCTVIDRLIGDLQICLSVGSSSSLPELVWYSVKMGTSLYLLEALPCVVWL